MTDAQKKFLAAAVGIATAYFTGNIVSGAIIGGLVFVLAFADQMRAHPLSYEELFGDEYEYDQNSPTDPHKPMSVWDRWDS